MKEEPVTKFYFDGKIARVVFEHDEERKVYWVDMTELLKFGYRSLHIHFYYLLNFFCRYPSRLLPIEEWLKENNMNYVEDDMVLFAMRWL